MSLSEDCTRHLQALREEGAERRDPIGWHHALALSERMRQHSGGVQVLLQARLLRALDELSARLAAAAPHPGAAPAPAHPPSPLAQLLQDMTAPVSQGAAPQASVPRAWPTENPRVQQFRKQLRKISIQKQVSQALTQAPRNAGPINSHMLVVRALGLMRDIAPDYLNRFMQHVDTLLCLDDMAHAPTVPKKTSSAPRTAKKASKP